MAKTNSTAVKPDQPQQSSFIKFCKDNEFYMQWICLGGIFFCHSQYAFLQESLLGDKSLKLNVSVVLMFQNIIAILTSSAIILATGLPGGLTQAFTMDDLTVSFFNFGSMNFSNRAMKVVPYPFVLLCKSAKIIPVIMVGTVRGVYTPSPKQFLIAFAITIGLLIFNYKKFVGKVSKFLLLTNFRWRTSRLSSLASAWCLRACCLTA